MRTPNEHKVNLTDAHRDRDAAARGMIVVEPGPRDLFIDLDNGTDELNGLLRLAAAAGLAIEVVEIWPSRTEGHFHAHLRTTFSLSLALRIALQAALGSDRQRELLSVARLMQGITPTVTFETPERAEKIRDSQVPKTNDRYDPLDLVETD